MKKIILIMIAIYSYSFPQFEESDQCAPEIYLLVKNFPSHSFPISFYMKRISTTYCIYNNYWDECYSCDKNAIEIMTSNNTVSSNCCGWTRCQDDILNDCYNDNYGYGVYKIYNTYNSLYFYFDFRDCNYWTNYGEDFRLIFNYENNNGKFYWQIGSNGDEFEIFNDQIIKIEDIFNQQIANTNCFPNYWQNSLALIDENFHPKLIWSTDANVNVTHYKIYRSVS